MKKKASRIDFRLVYQETVFYGQAKADGRIETLSPAKQQP